MINFAKLDSNELRAHGLVFETEAEAELFAEIIQEEFEARLGMAIAEGIDESKLAEFDECTTRADSQAWLEKNRPDYRRIVEKESAAFDQEIMAFRDRIPGLILQSHRDISDCSIEEMDLGVRSMNCLKHAGLKTVQDILDYGDLSKIRNLSRSCVEEIYERIEELRGQQAKCDRFFEEPEWVIMK